MMDEDTKKEIMRAGILAGCLLLFVGIGYGLALLKQELNYSSTFIQAFVCGRDMPRTQVFNGTSYALSQMEFDARTDDVYLTLGYARVIDIGGKTDKTDLKNVSVKGGACLDYLAQQKYLQMQGQKIWTGNVSDWAMGNAT
jgi:hypothetical protein